MLVLLLAVLSSLQLISADQSKNTSQPHIIFILADDLVSMNTSEYELRGVTLNYQFVSKAGF